MYAWVTIMPVQSSGPRASRMPLHLVEVVAQPLHHLRLRHATEGGRALVGKLRHHREPVRLRHLAGPPRRVEGAEVALGRVDDVADDVSRRPTGTGGRRLPDLGSFSQGEHPLGLVAHHPQDGRPCPRRSWRSTHSCTTPLLWRLRMWRDVRRYSSSWWPPKYISGSLKSSIWMPSGSLKYIDSSMPRSGPAYVTPSASSRFWACSHWSRGIEIAMC